MVKRLLTTHDKAHGIYIAGADPGFFKRGRSILDLQTKKDPPMYSLMVYLKPLNAN